MAVRKRNTPEPASPYAELEQPYRMLAENLDASIEQLTDASTVADDGPQELKSIFDFSMCNDLLITCEDALEFVLEPDGATHLRDAFDELVMFLNEEGVRRIISDWDEMEALIETDDADAPVVEDCLDNGSKKLNQVYELVTNLPQAYNKDHV